MGASRPTITRTPRRQTNGSANCAMIVQCLDSLADRHVQRREVHRHERELCRDELAYCPHRRDLVIIGQTSAVDVEEALCPGVLIAATVARPSILGGRRGTLE